ncbi:phosphonate C-P lyase system protein PhnH [Ferrovibrio terrae]|uniref:Phosphonate C-P lyase system protein PhnH n=1 Tax=Ferrovibrio terrae TaxID=2594003 RepID=A0A516H151_9PROT|nr:phosphonate C-P lyase system protein PhnH [Ferrovibrio terrae]QDO97494.1 phosphonate C-P lyase system protein PhnH [Ferrovibrio terrae]
MTEILETPATGFDDPVQQSQQAFRALLDAMARPGRVVTVETETGHPDGLSPALAAALLTLADLDTPVWLGPGFDTDAVRTWLRFHSGAPLAAKPDQAAFAVLDAAQMPALETFSFGTDESPERGATLLVQVQSLGGPSLMTWRGPGIKDSISMSFCGLDQSLWRQRAALSIEFPRGVDLYLGCGRDLVALPRSTAISFEGA